MAELEQIFWFVLPIVIGVVIGGVIAWLMSSKWKAKIALQRKQEREIKDLVTSE